MSNDFFAREKHLLKCVGLSLDDNKSFCYKMYSLVVILFVNVGYTGLQVTSAVNAVRHGYIPNEVMPFLFGSMIVMVKTYIMLRHGKDVKNIFDRLQKELSKVLQKEMEEEGRLIKECLFVAKMQVNTYWSSVCIVITLNTTYSIITRVTSSDYNHWKFPFGNICVFNLTYSPNFEIISAYQALGIIFIGGHYVTVDLIIMSTLCHLCYHCKILQALLRKLGKNVLGDKCRLSIPSENESISQFSLQKQLKQTVQYHIKIITITKKVENTFNRSILSNFLGALFTVSFMVYRISLLSLDDPECLSLFLEVIVHSFQMLLICFWGEQLVHESAAVGRAAFEADFVGKDVGLQKSLIMIMRRSEQPLQITVGKFAVVNFATYAWIMRSAYSTFMLLRNKTA